jgi:hypothetical protein
MACLGFLLYLVIPLFFSGIAFNSILEKHGGVDAPCDVPIPFWMSVMKVIMIVLGVLFFLRAWVLTQCNEYFAEQDDDGGCLPVDAFDEDKSCPQNFAEMLCTTGGVGGCCGKSFYESNVSRLLNFLYPPPSSS